MTTSHLTVAVIDDDDSVRAALHQLLRSAGFDALTFSTAEAFLESRKRLRVDCVVIDVNLPGMSGVALIKALEASGDRLPAVLISARDDPNTLALVKSCETVPFLRKPFSDAELLKAIAHARKRFKSEEQ